jgi:heme-degrading monooxygenase HmoA
MTGMVITLFRSRLTELAGDDYATMSAEMLDRARRYPGFVAMKSFTADDGERLTVVWWENEDLLLAWRRDGRHVEAQRKGRERWYHYYHMEVASVMRESHFVR